VGKRGQPAIQIAVNPDGAHAVGLQLDRDHLTGVLVNLDGLVNFRVVTEWRFPTPDEALPLLAQAVEHLCAQAGVSSTKLWGVGVGVPGPIDIREGRLLAPPNFPGWDNYALRDELASLVNVPVYVETDATAAAIGDHWHGAGQRGDFFYVYLGEGIGGGLILDGHPYRGSSGSAGAFGHVSVDPYGGKCECGGTGCLELYASLSALHRTLEAEGRPYRREELVPMLVQGDKTLALWLEQAADRIVIALVAMANLLDPKSIVFGGRFPEPLLDRLLELVRERLPSRSLCSLNGGATVERALSSEDGVALGAAVLPLHHVFTPAHELLLKKFVGVPA